MSTEAKEYYRAYAQVDLEAIRHNIREARKNVKPGTKVMAIIKADAYGHGAIKVAKALRNLVDAYGVAIIEEAIELRQAGLEKMILILGYTGEERYEELVQYNISQTVYEYAMAKKLSDIAMKMGKKARVHIKVDTGMGRIGFAPTQEGAKEVKKISELPGIEIEGCFTHFARADETTIEPAREPFSKYMQFVDMLESKGIQIPIKHVCNSASIIGFSEANLDMVRSGITTYGIYPSHEVSKEKMILKPAMELKCHISYVKEVPENTPISYGGTYVTKRPTRVATVPLGYADGMKRDLSNKFSVLVHGEYAPILGRVCMDQFMIDVTDIKDVNEGDIVTIFGKDGDKVISVDEIAERAHSFSYEFLCSVTSRVPRKYINE